VPTVDLASASVWSRACSSRMCHKRRANACKERGECGGRRDLSNAKVPQFYDWPAVVVEAVEEDISGLYVAMQNFAVVDVLNAAAELEKPIIMTYNNILMYI
jgi:hypothetical protein